jgi:hypothetical protein
VASCLITIRRSEVIAPDFAAAYLNLGVVDLNLKDREAAFKQYVALKSPDSSMAEKLYAMIYRARILQVSEAGIEPLAAAK